MQTQYRIQRSSPSRHHSSPNLIIYYILSQNREKQKLFCMFSLFNFWSIFPGGRVSWPHLPLCADAHGSTRCRWSQLTIGLIRYCVSLARRYSRCWRRRADRKCRWSDGRTDACVVPIWPTAGFRDCMVRTRGLMLWETARARENAWHFPLPVSLP